VPTQSERNAETRRRLLVAARGVFAEKGFAQATVADVVRRAERSHGSFYLHFANKEAVLQTLLEDVMARLDLESRTAWRADDPGAGVRETVRRFVVAFGEDRDLWLILDQRSSSEPAFRDMSDRLFGQLVGSVLRGMEATETPGLLPSLDPEVLAQVLAAMLFDSTRHAFQAPHDWTTDALIDEIARVWCGALGYDARPSAPAGG
jgi:AcrR family transcriptional regulator